MFTVASVLVGYRPSGLGLAKFRNRALEGAVVRFEASVKGLLTNCLVGKVGAESDTLFSMIKALGLTVKVIVHTSNT